MLYFDNAATTRVSDDVRKIVDMYMTSEYGNPSSIHIAGTRASDRIEKVRNKILEHIGANPERGKVIFTSGASEANTTIILGLAKYLKETKRKTIITSTIEHSSVLKAVEYMGNIGFDIIYIKPDVNGIISPKKIKDMLTDEVGLVAIMAVNNEIGSIQNLEKIGKACKENNTLFFTDCVQAIGTTQILVEKMNIDFLSISGHKFHAPKGIGALYARNIDLLTPLIVGGGQEYGLRSGTENVPAIMGMGVALDNVYKTGISYLKIKRFFIKLLKNECNKNGVKVLFNGDSDTNASKILNMRFPGVDGQTLVMLLSGAERVCVSAGSACNSHENVPSRVLKEIGLSDEEALSSIRISFSKYNTLDDIALLAQKVAKCVGILLKRGG